jgi:hypothetical protein
MAHRGERVISRKAIAQGMSDVLRCPVCSCAHFSLPMRMRPRVQRASGTPCALWILGAKNTCKARAQCVARTRSHFVVVPAYAGTHTPRPLLLKKEDNAHREKQLPPVAMGPGVRRDDYEFKPPALPPRAPLPPRPCRNPRSIFRSAPPAPAPPYGRGARPSPPSSEGRGRRSR